MPERLTAMPASCVTPTPSSALEHGAGRLRERQRSRAMSSILWMRLRLTAAGLFLRCSRFARGLSNGAASKVILEGAEGILAATSEITAAARQIAAAAEEASTASREAATAATQQSRGAEDLAAAIEEIAALAGELKQQSA